MHRKVSKRTRPKALLWVVGTSALCTGMIYTVSKISSLSSSLNTMADRLQSTMKELERANQKLVENEKKFQRLEGQHKDFFAAVSHELKTPLTVLKGQLENMIMGYGDYQNHEKYLPKALKSAEDIEHLVKEILSIIKIERIDIGSSLEEISLSDMIGGLADEMKALADAKQISVWLDIPDDVKVLANRNLFHKALSNVLGNAIRHSNQGADVYVNFHRGKNILIIENTGVFIPEDKIERMFIPFYRPDKSRNKATGGSGLGLYIVKTILGLHGMGYRMANTERGVAFYIQLTQK